MPILGFIKVFSGTSERKCQEIAYRVYIVSAIMKKKTRTTNLFAYGDEYQFHTLNTVIVVHRVNWNIGMMPLQLYLL